MVHVLKRTPKAGQELLKGFFAQSSATVHEAMARRGAMDMNIKPLSPKMKACGRALTVRCHPGDNLMLIKAVSMAQAGDILVCDMGKMVNEGPFGEVLAVECMSRGLAGLVTTSAVRDGDAIIRLGFPVFSAGLCISGTVKATLGTINHPISCGNILVKPGDIVLGDSDGVVVIPLEEAPEILAKSEKRVQDEAVTMQRLRKGESLFDIYGYQRIFDTLGCIEESE
jgi:4-hydroxy-4-methyl-2-oxoglutarate aldolase